MSKLLCGVSKVNITPPEDLIPGLYGLMKCHFAGVIDELHVRLLIISNGDSKAVFVSWDLDKAPNPETYVPLLAKKLDVPEDCILFFGVHTHTAPSHSMRLNDGPNARPLQSEDVQKATLRYEDLLKEKLIIAADEAAANMKEVRMGWGLGKSYVGENRIQDYYVEQEDGSVICETSLGSNPEGPYDPTLFVMRLEDPDGHPVAFLVNHAVHACIMILNNFDGEGGVGISADLPGQISTLLETRFPGCVALWSSGAAGDINPRMMNQYNYADPMTGKPSGFRDYKTDEPARLMLLMLSRRQFADVLQTNHSITCVAEDVAITADSKVVELDIPGRDDPYQIRLRSVKIGDLIFCGISGELYGSLGRALQGISPAEHTVIINHDSSLMYNSGYIFDDDALIRTKRPDGKRRGLPGGNTPLEPGMLLPELLTTGKELFEGL